MELMDEVLDSQEKEGFRPLKENRLRRSDLPMLVCDSEVVTRAQTVAPPAPRSPASARPGVASGVGVAPKSVDSVWIRSSGVIGSDIVPEIVRVF